MNMHVNTGFCITMTALVLVAASWVVGTGDTVSAQDGVSRDCHFSLFSDRRMSTEKLPHSSPSVFLLDECTGDTWIRSGRRWRALDR